MPPGRNVECTAPQHRRSRPGRHRTASVSGAERSRGTTHRLSATGLLAAAGLLLVGTGGFPLGGTDAADDPAIVAAVDPVAVAPSTGGRAVPERPVPERSTAARRAEDRRNEGLRPSRAGGRDHLERDRSDRERDRSDRSRSDRWVLPVAKYTLSAGFGDSGSLWSSGSHTGLDFAAPEGTPVRSVAAGVVTTAGYHARTSWAGNLVVVRLAGGTQIWYAHQRSVAVAVGDRVRPGQLVGRVGSTGNSSGPHLHLEVQVRGEPIDPERVLGRHELTP